MTTRLLFLVFFLSSAIYAHCDRGGVSVETGTFSECSPTAESTCGVRLDANTLSLAEGDDVNDNVDEALEIRISSIEGVAAAISANSLFQTVEIIDDDITVAAFAASAQSGFEFIGAPSLLATLDPISSRDVVVDFTMTPGTATYSQDYAGAETGTVLFLSFTDQAYLGPFFVYPDGMTENSEAIEFNWTRTTPIGEPTLDQLTDSILDYSPFEWTGAAGVGKSEDNIIWIDATQEPTGNRSSLINQSPNAISINEQSGPANNTANSINGQNALDFNGSASAGSADYYEIENNPKINTSGTVDKLAYFFVFSPDVVPTSTSTTSNPTANECRMIYEQGAGSRGTSIYLYNNKLYFHAWNNTNDDGGDNNATPDTIEGNQAPWGNDGNSTNSVWAASLQTLATGENYTVSCIYDNFSSEPLQIYVNGVKGITSNTSAGYNQFGVGRLWVHAGRIGLGAVNNGTRYHFSSSTGGADGVCAFDGKLAEFISFHEPELSEARRVIIENYLSAKYDIPLISSDTPQVWDLSDPEQDLFSNQIAGIGQAADGSAHTDAAGPNAIFRVNSPTFNSTNSYALWGHNGDSLANTTSSGLPESIQERSEQIWKIYESGDVTTASIQINFGALDNAGQLSQDFNLLKLLTHTNADPQDFSNASTYNLASPSAGLPGGNEARFQNIPISNGMYVTLGQTGSCADTLDLGVESANSLCSGTALLNDLWQNPSIILPLGGIWTAPDGTILPAGQVDVNTSPSGIYSYFYINAEGCLVKLSMQLNIAPDGGEPFPANEIDVCLLDPPFAPFDSLLGVPASLSGNWIYYSDDPPPTNFLLFSNTGSATTWTLNPADYNDGASGPMVDGYVVFFSSDPACGFGQDTIYIDVFEAFDAGQFTSATICEGDAPFVLESLLLGTPNVGGSWEDVNGNAVANLFDPAAVAPDSTYTLIYSGGLGGTNCFNSQELQLTVSADSDAPTIACPEDIQVSVNNDNCTATSQYTLPTTADECSTVELNLVEGLPSGSEFSLGSNSITYSAADTNGNSATCSFLIQVVDFDPPEISCQDIAVELGENGEAVVSIDDIQGSSNDLCGVFSESLSQSIFTESDLGVNQVTFTSVDNNGNTATCISNVEVTSCNVDGGVVSTNDPRLNLCIGDGESNFIVVELSGNQGALGRYGIVESTTQNIVGGNGNGVFNMENYPPGSYFIGHVSFTDENFFEGVNNVDDLQGCYDVSNLISVSSFLIDGGTISTVDSLTVCVNDGISSSVVFDVEGNFGPNFFWAILDQGFNEVVRSNQTGIFNVESLQPGIYKVAHAAFGNGVNIGQVDPQNIQGCVNTSNTLTLVTTDCTQAFMSITPNPTTAQSSVSFHVDQTERVLLEVYDMGGRLLERVYEGIAQEGEDYVYKVNLTGYANGVYICSLTTESSVVRKKLMLSK